MIKQYSEGGQISYQYYQNRQFVMRMSNNISSLAVSGSGSNGIKSQLTRIDSLNQNVSILEPYCFCGCKKLIEVNLTNSNLRQIGESAFRDCTNITDVKMNWTQDVGNWTFCRCSNLSNVGMDGLEGD